MNDNSYCKLTELHMIGNKLTGESVIIEEMF